MVGFPKLLDIPNISEILRVKFKPMRFKYKGYSMYAFVINVTF